MDLRDRHQASRVGGVLEKLLASIVQFGDDRNRFAVERFRGTNPEKSLIRTADSNTYKETSSRWDIACCVSLRARWRPAISCLPANSFTRTSWREPDNVLGRQHRSNLGACLVESSCRDWTFRRTDNLHYVCLEHYA
jgi:hypothetical protein